MSELHRDLEFVYAERRQPNVIRQRKTLLFCLCREHDVCRPFSAKV